MSTIRIAKRTKFTVVSNEMASDQSLSFRARGVLLWLLSKPDDWSCDSVAIARAGQEGREAIRQALCDLERAGYLRTQKVHRGNLTVTETMVFERPVSEAERTNLRVSPREKRQASTSPGVGFSDAENSASENQASDDQTSGSPAAEDQTSEGPTQLKTENKRLTPKTENKDSRPKTETLPAPANAAAPSPDGEDGAVSDLCRYLAERVAEHRQVALPKWDTAAWQRPMDLLLRRGSAKWAQPARLHPDLVRKAIDFTFTELTVPERANFCWADVIQSADSLRKHWDDLVAASSRLRRQGSQSAHSARQTNLDVVREAYRQEKEAG